MSDDKRNDTPYALTSNDELAIDAAERCPNCPRDYNHTASCYVRVLCERHRFRVNDGSDRLVRMFVTDLVGRTEAMSGRADEGWRGSLVFSTFGGQK